MPISRQGQIGDDRVLFEDGVHAALVGQPLQVLVARSLTCAAHLLKDSRQNVHIARLILEDVGVAEDKAERPADMCLILEQLVPRVSHVLWA